MPETTAGRSNLGSFISGYASVFDLMGRGIEPPDMDDGFERDAEALAGDWWRVGQDIRAAMDKVAAGE